ncbi:MAG: hypothetical protein A2W65_00200 [Candidatus Taylorbacteria bacterium RIFCSPLOWO2_02_50_13]|nr:MAG: hypothetical protein A2W65_00200 [Candidatus Taylorbacteria bacterium RIFCSPLOWO2_02_50_13]
MREPFLKRIKMDSALFPPAGGVWEGMRAGFGLGVSDFKNSPLDFVPMKLAHRRYYSNKDTNQCQIF